MSQATSPAAHTSPVLANVFSFLMGEPVQVVELESEPICTHYCFEGPGVNED